MSGIYVLCSIMSKKVILFIATSLDGFIATKDESVSWLDKYNETWEDYGFKSFYDSVDTVILGNATFKQFPDAYPDKECFVFSRKEQGLKDSVTYFNWVPEDVMKLVAVDSNKSAWLVGGANIVNQFLQANLIDEFIIFTMPVILGSWVRLFGEKNQELQLQLTNHKIHKSGVCEMHYKKIK